MTGKENTNSRLKELEQALQESEQRYHQLVDHSPDAIGIHSNGIIRTINSAGLKLIGAEAEHQIIGYPVLQFVHPDDLGTVLARIQKVIEKKQVLERIEYRILKLNGEVAHVVVHSNPVNYEGEPAVQVFIRDITEQKKVEAALKASEFRFKALFNQNIDGVTIVGLDGRILEANPRAAEMLGYERGEIVGMRATELSTPTEVEQTENILNRVLAGETPPIYERTARRKDGTSFTADVRVSLIVDPDGKPLFIQSVFRDITKQKIAEQALRDSEFRYRALINQSNEGVTMVDSEGFLIDANPRALEILGYEYDELIGLPAEALSVPEEVRDTKAVVEALRRGEEIAPYDRTILRKDGARCVIRLSVARVSDQNGKMLFMQSIFNDITREKQQEKALIESEFRYKALFNQGVEGIIISDMDFNIFNANPKAAEIFGYDLDELIGESVILFAVEEENPDTEEKLAAIMAGEQVPAFERKIRVKDGSILPVEVSLSLISDEDGVPIYMQNIFRDITERKEYERQLKFLATHDQLTGLPNRALFFDRLHHALSLAKRYQRELGVLFLDLDGFKNINDVYGHAQGDRMLEAIGKRLAEQVRESDTIARIGGDEFTMIIHEASGVKEALQLSERILEVLNQPFKFNNHEIRVTGSIGISLFPKHGEDPEELVGCADKAMYVAKNYGKNSVAVFGKSPVVIKT